MLQRALFRGRRAARFARSPQGGSPPWNPQTDALDPYPAVLKDVARAFARARTQAKEMEGRASRAGLSRGMYGLSVLQSPLVFGLREAPPI